MALERIVAQKRIDVAARMEARPLASLRRTLVASDRSLEDALRKPRTGYILECKKASPSKGLLRASFDVAELAKIYSPVADAISVVTDEPFFQGRHDWIPIARKAVSVPILCKDFVVDPYQVVEARWYGADAVLLMLSVLNDDEFRSCFAVCEELAMDALVEVHTAEELDRAIALGARIIGVNNRDLRTLHIDLSTTERLAKNVPKDRILVSESGIETHSDIRRLRSHVDAFLIGSSLVGADRPARALREIVYGRVKVCGLTREDDATLCWKQGASLGGMIFAEESPRVVDVKQAKRLVRIADLDWVGVFVNAPLERVCDVANELGLSAVQLHGDETEQEVVSLRAKLNSRCAIWKAFRVRNEAPPPLSQTSADRYVLDTHRDDQRGGTGERFDWKLLRGYGDLENVIVGGGLSAQHATEADDLGAWALDVNSGVEEAKGVKSEQKVQAFFAGLRGLGLRRLVP